MSAKVALPYDLPSEKACTASVMPAAQVIVSMPVPALAPQPYVEEQPSHSNQEQRQPDTGLPSPAQDLEVPSRSLVGPGSDLLGELDDVGHWH